MKHKAIAVILSIVLVQSAVSSPVFTFATPASSEFNDEIISPQAIDFAEDDNTYVLENQISIDLSKPHSIKGAFSPYAIEKAYIYGKAPLYRDILTNGARQIYDEIGKNADVNAIYYKEVNTNLGTIMCPLVSFTIDTSSLGLNYSRDDVVLENGAAKQDLENALYGYIYDNPESNWFTHSSTSFSISTLTGNVKSMTLFLFTIGDTQECSNLINEAQAWRSGVLNEANKLNTRYEKLKYVHDLICSKVSYGYDPSVQNSLDGKFWYSHSIFGVSSGDKVVCEGYAKAFKYVCDALNIPCVFQSGDGINGSDGHAWDLVQPNNNMWYYADLTWDDSYSGYGSYTYEYFLCGTDVFEPSHRDYEYNNDMNLSISQTAYDASSETEPSTEPDTNHCVEAIPTTEPYTSNDVGTEPDTEPDTNNCVETEPSTEPDTNNDVETEPSTEEGTVIYGDYTINVASGEATIISYTGTPSRTENFVIPANIGGFKVTAIGNEAFSGINIGENDIIIPEGIETLGTKCFHRVKAKRALIPSTVKTLVGDMYAYIFSYANIEEIVVDNNNPYFCSENGVFFSKDKSVLYNYPIAKSAEYYVAPAETSVLACTSFAMASNLKDVYFYSPDVHYLTYTFAYDTLTIHGAEGSTDLQSLITKTQERAASENTDKYGILNFKVLAQGDPDRNLSDVSIQGDVDDNGQVDSMDGLRLLKYVAGLDVTINKEVADLNGDGTIDSLDSLRLLRFVAGLGPNL